MNTLAHLDWRIPNYSEGHGTFIITAEITKFAGQEPYFSMTGWYKDGTDEWGGCCHDEIVKAMPVLEKYLKWHLCSTSGPMHYIQNTVYLAGNRDCWGRAQGEPSATTYVARFGNSPASHRVSKNFWYWLDSGDWYDMRYELQIISVPHKDTGSSGGYKFGPNYTLTTYPAEWHTCPFKDYTEASEFLKAMQECTIELVEVPIAWSEGKERELEAARRSAIWPDATDEELSVDSETLAAALKARLPALLDAFQADIIELFGDQIQFVPKE